MKSISLSDFTEKDYYILHGMCKPAHPAYAADCYEIIYIAHGTGTYGISGANYSASEGDIFLSSPGTAHKLSPGQDLRGIEIYCCYFTGQAAAAFLPDMTEEFSGFSDFISHKNRFLRAADTENREIRHIMIQMIDEQLTPKPCCFSVIQSYLPILLVKILRNQQNYDFKRTYSHNMTVDTAVHFIYSKLYTKVSLADIAEYMKVSPSYICRLFRRHIGMTPVSYIQFLRIEKMKDVLRNTDRPVNRVTSMFTLDEDYLRQLFKRETGMTIQEYHDRYNYKYNPSTHS